MKIERAFQRAILEFLAENAGKVSLPKNGVHLWQMDEDHDKIRANLIYLEDHGLIEIQPHQNAGKWIGDIPPLCRITARGIDFLLDDGGLSAILNVQTVRIHADTLRDLIEARLVQLPLPPEEKRKFIDHLRSLPSESLHILSTRLLEKGVDTLLSHSADAAHALRAMLGL